MREKEESRGRTSTRYSLIENFLRNVILLFNDSSDCIHDEEERDSLNLIVDEERVPLCPQIKTT